MPRRWPAPILNYMKRGISLLGTAALVLPVCVAMSAVLLAPRQLSADDLKLKDGSKISGTIVGFEENSFKVKTSYGFAVVQKDQVVSIAMSDAPKVAAEKSPEPAAEKTSPAEKPKSESLKAASAPPLPAMAGTTAEPVAKAAPPPASATKIAKIASPAPTPAPVAKTTPPAAAPIAKAAAPPAAAAVPVASAAPPKPPAPEPIRESVNGNTYTNETYRFHMYKPPTWDVIATAPAVLPGAITAMGTGDDTTYLLIGQEPAGKSLATAMDTTERRLRDVMENFRPMDEKQITVSGAAATEHTFRGSVDQHDWSGVVVLVPRGAKLYTIFGMTRADNDLVQIQENVIARAISSLQFTD
ncbi:MAG: hypothetical protein P4L00_04865 [Candidatus Acidoferrales bacterium]|nr:hypothetical protein [Candidatus Acidoferrales bacterium]